MTTEVVVEGCAKCRGEVVVDHEVETRIEDDEEIGDVDYVINPPPQCQREARLENLKTFPVSEALSLSSDVHLSRERWCCRK